MTASTLANRCAEYLPAEADDIIALYEGFADTARERALSTSDAVALSACCAALGVSAEAGASALAHILDRVPEAANATEVVAFARESSPGDYPDVRQYDVALRLAAAPASFIEVPA